MEGLKVLAAIVGLVGVPMLFVWCICKCAEGVVEHIHPAGKRNKNAD